MDRFTTATRRRAALSRRRQRVQQVVATALLGSAFTRPDVVRRRDDA
ncbi:hypothetical protein QE370_000855 [Aeromicrobium sp. SORGH_AS981]|nr:hypothetical protein [Aeromicrobium sp. SORGH_AS_0981]MDR6117671.1 hypothetical protein [Aeromicrobium sp. SORGH_AS_0981]